MLTLLSLSHRSGATVNVRAWRSDGNIVEYSGWLVHHDYWRGGYVRLRNPVNGEIRMVPQIFIFELNNHPIYL